MGMIISDYCLTLAVILLIVAVFLVLKMIEMQRARINSLEIEFNKIQKQAETAQDIAWRAYHMIVGLEDRIRKEKEYRQ